MISTPFLRLTALLTVSLFTSSLLAVAASAQSSGDFSGQYRFKTMWRGDGECLESNGAASAYQGGNAFMDTCQDVSGQLWSIEDAGNGHYRLKTMSQGSGNCLESNGAASDYHGGNAFMDTCKDVSGQLWSIEDAGNGHYRLKTMSQGSGECLEGNSPIERADIMGGSAYMDACQNVSGQFWHLVQEGGVTGGGTDSIIGGGNDSSTDDGTEGEAGVETMTIDGTVVKTGHIQVTLEWDNPAESVVDLDLYVADPAGAEVSYLQRNVPSGGELDVDARVDCQNTENTVENIIWQSAADGTPPPAGTYSVRVNHYGCGSDTAEVPYIVTLRRDGQVVGQPWTGTSTYGVFGETYTFTAN